ncbi:TIGR02757 family protein [Endomicrobium proavitum]|uniref:TIGR02757 family protein n=1 Tax=Endomicrobium proavitum TaxID=1408281 RepID=A0A0G3WIG2_9BACT|nr:TIGR02757 family protein [Endomicrobium proavitum]AKL98088.1 hypothetical protein Epro_0709 [Endomicrobium proavitum]
MLHEIKKLLDIEVANKNTSLELSATAAADPLRVAKKHKDDFVAVICALFAYGNAKLIEKFLLSLDFSALNDDEKTIRKKLQGCYYRFQTNEDVVQLFKTLSLLKKKHSLEELFLQGYLKGGVIAGIKTVLEKMYSLNSYRSQGYEFLLGKIPDKNPSSPYKRWNLFLRWVVRSDELDMGLWRGVNKASLLMPLDVHTFNVSKKLGLLKRKTYDFKAVLELTETLKTFDAADPIKYDFAIYRLGQSHEIEKYLS